MELVQKFLGGRGGSSRFDNADDEERELSGLAPRYCLRSGSLSGKTVPVSSTSHSSSSTHTFQYKWWLLRLWATHEPCSTSGSSSSAMMKTRLFSTLFPLTSCNSENALPQVLLYSPHPHASFFKWEKIFIWRNFFLRFKHFLLITFNLFTAKWLCELSKSKLVWNVFFNVESMKVMHMLRALLTLQSIHTCIADFVHESAVINMASRMINALTKAFSHHPIMSIFLIKAFDVCCLMILPTAIIIWHQ